MRCRRGSFALVALLAAGCGSSHHGGGDPPQPATGHTVSAVSCAGLSPAQQQRRARVILTGTMLPGPTAVVNGHPSLATPARMRVTRYLKGRGPGTVDVMTAAAGAGARTRVSEDGIAPRAGERWEILSTSTREPLSTSVCLGSHLIPASLRTQSRFRVFTGGGLRFRYPATWRAYRWQEPSSLSALIVDLSNQPEYPPCTTHHGAHNTTINCREPLRRLGPDSILAEWSSVGQPGFRLAATPGTPTLVGGRPARVQVTDDDCSIGAARSLTAVIEVPGGDGYFEFHACLSGPDPSVQERRARALLATVRWL